MAVRISTVTLLLAFGSSLIAADDTAIPGEIESYSMGMLLNDTFTGKDRWQTASYQRSFYRVDADTIKSEIRLNFGIIAPASLERPNRRNDRPYVAYNTVAFLYGGSFGDFHFQAGPSLTILTEEFGPKAAQSLIHEILGIPAANVDGFQVLGGEIFGLEANIRYIWKHNYGYLIPFAEAEFGNVDMVRVGADLILADGNKIILSRDKVSGLPFFNERHGARDDFSFSFVAGGDIAYVFDDYYINNRWSNVEFEELRYRLRSGVRWQFGDIVSYWGVSYLSPEFKEQPEGQLVVGVSLSFRF